MTTVNPFSDGCFQQDNVPFLNVHIISSWFPEQINEFTVLQWPPESNWAPLESGETGDSHHECRIKSLMQLQDSVMST